MSTYLCSNVMGCMHTWMQIVPEVESFTVGNGVRFVDGKEMAFDAVVFATGYRSNVPCWLKVSTSVVAGDRPLPPRSTTSLAANRCTLK